MIPFFKHTFRLLLHDELAFVRWFRGLLISFAVGGIALGDELDPYLDGDVISGIKVAAIVCGFIAGATTAGERNK
jgi:hypothetical protein